MRNKPPVVRHAKKRLTSPHRHSSNVNDISSDKRRSQKCWYFSVIVVLIIMGFLLMCLYTIPINDIVSKSDFHTFSTSLRTENPVVIIDTPTIDHQIQSISYNKSSYINEIISYSEKFQQHPLFTAQGQQLLSGTLDEVMEFIYQQDACHQKPLFSTMANVMSDLYWQMIENFMYTLAKYNHSSCALMICVSDSSCMKKCHDSMFPCYNYDYHHYHKNIEVLPSALEQIAELKLLHMPKALAHGVDIFVVDLDVGFLADPMILLHQYITMPQIDIFVQEDVTFIMDRSVEKWKTWYTSPMPNIGLFLCRGNKKTVQMFALAWEDYQTMNPAIKKNPGKDQNKVVSAMYKCRQYYGLKWKYLSKKQAVLLDKIYKFSDQTYELGGEAAYKAMDPATTIAAHTTCYEQKTKVTGLKAVNAFWNPRYYDPNRRTITKKLLFTGPATNALLDEIRSLMYLAMISKRALILPNVLGDDSMIRDAVQYYQGHPLWPGFRLVYFKEDVKEYKMDILEPAYYWRIHTSSSYGDMVSSPTIICIPPTSTFAEAEQLVLGVEYQNKNRVVLHMGSNQECNSKGSFTSLIAWADDSVGVYDDYVQEIKRYEFLPTIKSSLKASSSVADGQSLSDANLARNVIDSTRLCARVFEHMRGNRSCFDKCD